MHVPAFVAPSPRRTAAHVALLALAALAACADPATAPADASAPVRYAGADGAAPATLAWEETARGLIIKYASSPIAASRVLSLVGVARYAGVVDAAQGNGRRNFEAERGAIAGASAAALAYMYPLETDALNAMAVAQGETGPGEPHPHYARGVEIGRAAAAQVIERAKTDGYTAVWTGTVPVGPGRWIKGGPPPAGAQLPGMKPFFLTSAGQFRPGPPPAFGSPEFLAALAAVRQASDTRTPEQLRIAQFWGTGIPTPSYWDIQAARLIEAAGLDEREASRQLALMNAAMMDASIACFDAKYTYWFIRPSQADPAITLPVGLPNHPSYPSGHSCISGSAAGVLAKLHPSEAPQLAAQVLEAGQSRFYAGLHYQFDILAGQAIGRQAAATALEFDRTKGLLAAVR